MRIVRARTTIEDLEEFLAEIRTVGEETGATIQCFDARYVAGERHLRRATALAERASEQGRAVADDPAVEMLLYAAGRRQINRAHEMGVSTGDHEIVAVVTGGDDAAAEERLAAEWDGPDGDGWNDTEASGDQTGDDGTTTLGEPETLRAFFDIPAAELAVVDADLEAVVLERVALLDVEK